MSLNPRRRTPPRRRERGVVLIIAMIMLVAMTLLGISLFRQVDMGVVIASNLGFKQSASVASDRGIEAARAWWMAQTAATLEQPNVAAGYYPAWCNTAIIDGRPDANADGLTDDCGASPPPADFDPLTYNWTNSAEAIGDDGAGNRIRYVIHRMCRVPGSINDAGQQCVTIGSSTSSGAKVVQDYSNQTLTSTMQPYYRITTRTDGPRNTRVYSQALLY